MGLELDLDGRGKEKEMRNGYVLEERLYKTEDGEVVREGDPRAAYVYRGPGRKIPMEEAVALGLVGDEPAEQAAAGDGSGDAGNADGSSTGLSSLSREDLNAKAAELGIEKPEKIKGGKPKVIEAIEAEQAAAGDGSGDAGE